MKCNCEGTIVDADGEFVCRICGTVHGYSMEPPKQTGYTGDACSYNFATTMGQHTKDYIGRVIDKKTVNTKRLQRVNGWCQACEYRSLPVGLVQLSKIRTELSMTDAAGEYAVYMFRRIVASKFMAGRTLTHFVAAIALLACRKHNLPRSLDDIVAVTGLSKHIIRRVYRQIYERFDIVLPIPDPVSLIARIGSEVGIGEAVRRDAIHILSTLSNTDVAGKSPISLAASALYMACVERGEPIIRHNIAKAAGIADTTLANRYTALTKIVRGV